MNYAAIICGGSGPNVWGTEITLVGDDFLDAARQADAIAKEAGGHVLELRQF